MKTFEDIKSVIQSQNLSNLYKCDTQQMYEEFCKYATEQGLITQFTPLEKVDSAKTIPIFYIIYNKDLNQFELHCDLFSKKNSVIEWEKHMEVLVSWKLYSDGNYMLEYNSSSKASIIFSSKLPSIKKIDN